MHLAILLHNIFVVALYGVAPQILHIKHVFTLMPTTVDLLLLFIFLFKCKFIYKLCITASLFIVAIVIPRGGLLPLLLFTFLLLLIFFAFRPGPFVHVVRRLHRLDNLYL